MPAIPNRTLDETLAEAREDYARRRPASRAVHLAASEVMPGGNTRTVLFHGPFPFRVARGEGAIIEDLDGNRLLNLLGEHTAGVFGHDHSVIRAAIDAALDDGINFGAHTAHEERLARLVVARFPAIEKVRFTNSGTEANLMAIVTARHATGRARVMVFKGGYHGGLLAFAGGGSPINAPFPVVVARYNDAAAARAAILEAGDTLACVLVEPMMGSGGCIPADPGFLAALRQATAETGAFLILDEVMTSRLWRGGAQARHGLSPDLVSLGKWVGGGMSFGAFGGRAEIMDLYDPARPGALAHAGTFNNNVLSMRAGAAALERVFTADAAEALHARGDELRHRLNAVFERHGVVWQATGIGSLLNLHPVRGPIRSVDDLAGADERLRELMFLDLLARGVYIAKRGFMALSLAVTDADLDRFAGIVEEIVAERKLLWAGA